MAGFSSLVNFVINAENIFNLRMRSKRPSRTRSNNLRVAITDTGSSVVEEEKIQSLPTKKSMLKHC